MLVSGSSSLGSSEPCTLEAFTASGTLSTRFGGCFFFVR
jgi:hypothetical protein